MSGARTDPINDGADLPGRVRDRRDAADDEIEAEDGAGGGTSLTAGNVLSVSTGWTPHKFTFKHQRLLSTCGYQFQNIQSGKGDDINDCYTQKITTPYANVPVNCLPFYLTRAEYNMLPTGSSVKSVNVNINCIGYRMPFQANSTQIANVNSATLVLGMYAHGLVNKYGGHNVGYTVDTTNPMVPASLVTVTDAGCDEYKLWGNKNTAAGTYTYDTIGASFGKEFQLENYYCQQFIAADNNESLPSLVDDINIFRIQPHGSDGPTISYEYRPQVNCIKPTNVRIGRYANTTTGSKWETRLLYGYKTKASRYAPINTQPGFSQYLRIEPSKMLELNREEQRPTLDLYKTELEQAGLTSHGLQEYGGGFVPPTLHIGLMPVLSFTVTPDIKKCVPVVAVWSCTTTINIESSTQFTDPYLPLQPPNASVMYNVDPITLGDLPWTVHGYRAKVVGTSTDTAGQTKEVDKPA